MNWDDEVEFDNITIINDEFPTTLLIEFLTRVSKMHIGFEGDWDIKKYLVKIHAGKWSIQEEIN